MEQENEQINGHFSTADSFEHLPKGRYLLTSAQNNTDINKNFLDSLELYAKQNNCKILIAKLSYNKGVFGYNNLLPGEKIETWYDDRIEKYIILKNVILGGKVSFLAESNISPTAVNPLTGFESLAAHGNCILPSTRLSLKVVASMSGKPKNMLISTGCVTLRNYIPRKAGEVAKLHHANAAVYVDTATGDIRHLHQVQDYTGFFDEGILYTPQSATGGKSVEVLQLGDIHAEKMIKNRLEKSVELIRKFKPRNLMIHDLLDFSSRNHHNTKNPTFIHQQNVLGNTVEKDIKKMASVLDTLVSTLPKKSITHVVESNHDLAINRYLIEQDFKNDPVNAITYLQCMLEWYKHIKKSPNDTFCMLKYIYEAIGNGIYKKDKRLKFHLTGDSLQISGIEHANHGHLGVNGSRSTPIQFKSMLPANTGHTHTPSINGNCWTAGVSANLDLGYNLGGGSNWAYAHIVTWPNGQRQIIFN